LALLDALAVERFMKLIQAITCISTAINIKIFRKSWINGFCHPLLIIPGVVRIRADGLEVAGALSCRSGANCVLLPYLCQEKQATFFIQSRSIFSTGRTLNKGVGRKLFPAHTCYSGERDSPKTTAVLHSKRNTVLAWISDLPSPVINDSRT
jgi:hypothetical protein